MRTALTPSQAHAAPTPTPPGATAPGPLSPQDIREVAEAQRRGRKVLKAAGVAAFNGWACAIVAALAVPFALGSIPAALTALALGAVARNEFRGRKMLLRFDPRGPRLLGWNQIGLLAVIVLYCLWHIYDGLTGPTLADQHPDLKLVLGSLASLERNLTLGLYGSIIVVSAIAQGLTARYYFSRLTHLRGYLGQTPPWIVDLHRSVGPA